MKAPIPVLLVGLGSFFLIGSLPDSSSALATGGGTAAPLLGQRVSDAMFLKTAFCRTYGCRIGTTTITGTGSGNAEELNDRVTDVALNNGLTVQLEREVNTRLVSAYLKSISAVPAPLQWNGLANVAAGFFSLTLHRTVSMKSPEIQRCIQLFRGPHELDAPVGFWEVKGTKTGACTVFQSGTPAGPKTIFTFIAQLP